MWACSDGGRVDWRSSLENTDANCWFRRLAFLGVQEETKLLFSRSGTKCQTWLLIDQPTQYKNNQTLSLLDLKITKNQELLLSTEYLPLIGASDHICHNLLLSQQTSLH